MTDRDVLKRACEALRNASEPSDEELVRLRERVLKNKIKPVGERRVSRNVRWLLPLAAAFMAATALAATPGAWEGMLDATDRFLNIELLAPGQKTAQQRRTRHNTAPTTKGRHAAEPAEAEQPVAVPAPITDSTSQDTHPAAASPTTEVNVQAPASLHTTRGASERAPKRHVIPSGEDESVKAPTAREPSHDLQLYKSAHQSHFRDRNYGQALSAWEAYLQQMPSGTFAIEAKYNRALCLVRLGRYAEARAAFSEFAEGKVVGGYRRDEAARFIEALDKRP